MRDGLHHETRESSVPSVDQRTGDRQDGCRVEAGALEKAASGPFPFGARSQMARAAGSVVRAGGRETHRQASRRKLLQRLPVLLHETDHVACVRAVLNRSHQQDRPVDVQVDPIAVVFDVIDARFEAAAG